MELGSAGRGRNNGTETNILDEPIGSFLSFYPEVLVILSWRLVYAHEVLKPLGKKTLPNRSEGCLLGHVI